MVYICKNGHKLQKKRVNSGQTGAVPALLYLEDSGEGLPGDLVVNDGEEFGERPQEGGGLLRLPQQVLDGGQDVDLCLLKQTK